MKWLAVLLSVLLFGASSAVAQAEHCEDSEAACVLDAAWSAALILPEEKQTRLSDAFLEIAALSGDPTLLQKWERRFGKSLQKGSIYPDYGWQIAEPILAEKGVDELIQMAERRAEPMSFGRADVLLAAGKHLQQVDPEEAKRINTAFETIISTASSFEKPNLAHAAAELAMVRCDGPLMDQMLSLTDAPQNLRYAFWRARIEGNALGLLSRVRGIDNAEDTREVRRVLDGYRAILEYNYCSNGKTEIGG